MNKLILAAAAACAVASLARADILINEFQYDDTGTDDREFVELYNSGTVAVDIGNWSLRGNDPTGANTATTIPAGTMLGPGAFWVIGQTGVANVNQVVGTIFENDNETLELYNAATVLQDAVVYEANKGISTITGISNVLSQVGPGYWPNHQGVDIGTAAPLNVTTSVGRHLDGRDTNNNGIDFGMRPGTPGVSNQIGGTMTQYSPPNVDSLADGTLVGGLTGSFVGARVISPGTATAGLNPNPIAAPPGANKAIIGWDNSGGGNGIVSNAVFPNGGELRLQVYLDTANLPVSTNASGVQFRGSEETFYGVGTIDALMNLSDISGAVGLDANTTSANGATGIAWYYEKVGETTVGAGDVSEKLYLVNANDGGESNADRTTGFDWTVLTTIDLSTALSGWHTLSISVLPDGSGSAGFDEQTFAFTAASGLVGEFYVGYRENTQAGAVGVPDYLRPPTFAIPEPGSAILACAAGALLLLQRKRSSRGVAWTRSSR